MLVYINYKQYSGLISAIGFSSESKAIDFVHKELINLMHRNEIDFRLKCKNSEDLESLFKEKKPSIDQIKLMIAKYEEWSFNFGDRTIAHDLIDTKVIKYHE